MSLETKAYRTLSSIDVDRLIASAISKYSSNVDKLPIGKLIDLIASKVLVVGGDVFEIKGKVRKSLRKKRELEVFVHDYVGMGLKLMRFPEAQCYVGLNPLGAVNFTTLVEEVKLVKRYMDKVMDLRREKFRQEIGYEILAKAEGCIDDIREYMESGLMNWAYISPEIYLGSREHKAYLLFRISDVIKEIGSTVPKAQKVEDSETITLLNDLIRTLSSDRVRLNA